MYLTHAKDSFEMLRVSPVRLASSQSTLSTSKNSETGVSTPHLQTSPDTQRRATTSPKCEESSPKPLRIHISPHEQQQQEQLTVTATNETPDSLMIGS